MRVSRQIIFLLSCKTPIIQRLCLQNFNLTYNRLRFISGGVREGHTVQNSRQCELNM